MVQDVMSAFWSGMVEYNRSGVVRIWAQATASLDFFTFVSVFNNIIWLTLPIIMFGGVSKKRFFLFDPYKELIRKKIEAKQTARKEKYLDCLAACSEIWNNEYSLGYEESDILVNVGDVRDVSEPDLLAPLLPKTSKGTPEIVTVTILFSFCNLDRDSLSEKLNGVLKKSNDGKDALSWVGRGNIMQGSVELRDSVLDELENVYKLACDSDADCTLQIDSWGILKKGKRQVKVWSESEMPSIFHAEYAAGILAIAGSNLEEADVRVVNLQKGISTCALEGKLHEGNSYEMRKGMIFNRDRRSDMNFRVETWTFPLRIPSAEIDNVVIYASKKFNKDLEEESVLLHSTAVNAQDVLWSTVFRRWMAQILLLSVIIFQVVWVLCSFMTWMVESGGILLFLIWGPFIALIVVPALFRRFASSSTAAQDLVRAIWTIHFEALYIIRKEPHLSTTTMSLPCSTPCRGIIRSPAPTISSTSTTFESVIRSIARQQKKTTKNTISDSWEPIIVGTVNSVRGSLSWKKMEPNSLELDEEKSPFIVLYQGAESRQLPDQWKVLIVSQYLIKILHKHLSHREHLFSDCIEKPQLPSREIFSAVDRLCVQGAGIDEDQLNIAQLHLDLLVSYIKNQYKSVIPRFKRMAEEKLVSHDMLWAFLTPGRRVVYKCAHTESLLCATVAQPVQYKADDRISVQTNGVEKWQVDVMLHIWDYDGQRYRQYRINRLIRHFDGQRPWESLPVCPIDMMSASQDALEAEFVANGRRFYELAIQQDHRLMNYQGYVFQVQGRMRGPEVSHKLVDDGRVMIDTARFVSNNPGFKMQASPGRARGTLSYSCPPPSWNSEIFEDYQLPSASAEPTDETLIFAPGIVRGFSFALNQWGLFQLSGFSDVYFDGNAFDELVMEPKDKDMIYSLVYQYLADSVQQFPVTDTVSRKGQGCIIGCYGPPETGKTFTAESVAEKLGLPLLSVNLSQFANISDDMEFSLKMVLNAAFMWRAVVLMKVDMLSVRVPNSMIEVLMRHLDSHPGIMFVTTSRAEDLHHALRSRVSMFVQYRHLTSTQRALVWSNLLSRAGIHDSPDDDLSSIDLSTRGIKQVIHMAQLSAKIKNEPLRLDHVKTFATDYIKSRDRLAAVPSSSGSGPVKF
ncbi:hypothetical protein Mapa_003555 [Marchantia paleacea]|nr:hypothetical protein Mapa_003555 [Marchantia paleacea]